MFPYIFKERDKDAMKHRTIQTILGIALTDRQFCDGLLNGGRQELLSKFQLTADEHRFLLGIKANSLQGFAAAVDQWLSAQSQRLIYPGIE